MLDCYFVKAFYKIITGAPLTIEDVEDFDNEVYKSMKWLLDNDADLLGLVFSAEFDFFGKVEEIELKKNGKNIDVTNANKLEYCLRKAYQMLYKSIEIPMQEFLRGFYQLVPKNLVRLFEPRELELLISGLPTVDIQDLIEHSEFNHYSSTSPQILWLWEILEAFDNSERAEFLIFVTGSSKVPVDGFKALQGMRGPQIMNIHKMFGEDT